MALATASTKRASLKDIPHQTRNVCSSSLHPQLPPTSTKKRKLEYTTGNPAEGGTSDHLVKEPPAKRPKSSRAAAVVKPKEPVSRNPCVKLHWVPNPTPRQAPASQTAQKAQQPSGGDSGPRAPAMTYPASGGKDNAKTTHRHEINEHNQKGIPSSSSRVLARAAARGRAKPTKPPASPILRLDNTTTHPSVPLPSPRYIIGGNLASSPPLEPATPPSGPALPKPQQEKRRSKEEKQEEEKQKLKDWMERADALQATLAEHCNLPGYKCPKPMALLPSFRKNKPSSASPGRT